MSEPVVFRDEQYCLIRLGFGFNIVPMVVKAMISEILKEDDDIKQSASSYVDDILINEDVVSSDKVVSLA